MNWPAVDGLPRETPIVFPLGALEQHGRHMPLFTDSLLCAEITRRVAEMSRFRDGVVFAPLQWLGNSDHHGDFPGTLSASPRVYLDLLDDLLQNFIGHGFARLVFINAGEAGEFRRLEHRQGELHEFIRLDRFRCWFGHDSSVANLRGKFPLRSIPRPGSSRKTLIHKPPGSRYSRRVAATPECVPV